MKSLTILGIVALMMLLVLPGAVSAADVSVSGSVVDEDLVVTAISPNVGAGAFMFANEPNVISVTVTNNGGLDAEASTVSVVVGSNTYTAAVGALAAGASQTVTVTDPASYTAGTSVSYTATADSAGVIAESNEANNAMIQALTVLDNGYKGKQWTPTLGGDITTQATFDGRYDVKYSYGNSAYLSAKWLSATDTWTSSDLPIPAGATVVSARLYQPYSYNKMASDPAFTASFNDNTISTIATYKDRKNFGGTAGYDYPYGLYVYDVTSQFNMAGNTLILTPEGTPGTTNDYALWGAYLVVTYSDPATTEKQIWINDEFDMVYSRATYSTNTDEATAYAPFAGVSTSGLGNAKAIAILASAGDSGKSKFFFNSQEYTGFWADYKGATGEPQIGFSLYDVTSALQSGDNVARLQSYDPGTNGDNMYAMNTILVVEKSEASVSVDFTPATQVSGDKPYTVNFDSTVTGYVTSYAWTFGDGATSTEADPSHEYTTRGIYDVSLTVTGVGSSDTEAKTDLVVVKEPAPVVDFTYSPASGVEPLDVTFDATNTGGAVTTWNWEYKLTTDTTWTSFAATEDASHTFANGTYDIRLTATGPDYTDVETKTAAVSVGASSIAVSVSPSTIEFGTMAAGVDEEGATTVSVDVTGGTSWTVTASATHGGYMSTGTVNLANLFEISNDNKANWYDLSENLEFLTGVAGIDGSQVADVKQAIAAADAPGAYSITLTFEGSMA